MSIQPMSILITETSTVSSSMHSSDLASNLQSGAHAQLAKEREKANGDRSIKGNTVIRPLKKYPVIPLSSGLLQFFFSIFIIKKIIIFSFSLFTYMYAHIDHVGAIPEGLPVVLGGLTSASPTEINVNSPASCFYVHDVPQQDAVSSDVWRNINELLSPTSSLSFVAQRTAVASSSSSTAPAPTGTEAFAALSNMMTQRTDTTTQRVNELETSEKRWQGVATQLYQYIVDNSLSSQ